VSDDYSSADTHRDRYLRLVSPEAAALEEADRRLPVRAADAAQYAREPIPEEQRGRIRVRLLNAMPDPYGSVAALCAQYSGRVVRDLGQVTNSEREKVIDDMLATVLNGPLEVAQFHWQIEGVTRSITHQMVRSRASFFAQESLRFAVAENWAREVPLPPSLGGIDRWTEEEVAMGQNSLDYKAYLVWNQTMQFLERQYDKLIELGIPAEEARGVLPHDMPTRIHWVCDLRTLLQEAGKRTCTQAQFPWRIMFGQMAQELRRYGSETKAVRDAGQSWQFRDIAKRLRPVCFQTGKCGFMAQFDRSCNIRERVDALGAAGVPPRDWGDLQAIYEQTGDAELTAISDYEWAANPAAARS
jgi:flavin-dependent thymidylate synthase